MEKLSKRVNEISFNAAINLDKLIDRVDNETKCICDKCPPHKPGLNIKVAVVKFVKVSPK